VPSVGDLPRLAASFARHLQAENKSKKTIETYGEGVQQLLAHLACLGIDSANAISRAHIDDFIAKLLETRSATTMHTDSDRVVSDQIGLIRPPAAASRSTPRRHTTEPVDPTRITLQGDEVPFTHQELRRHSQTHDVRTRLDGADTSPLHLHDHYHRVISGRTACIVARMSPRDVQLPR
jgi:hypothetical protein